MGSKAVATSRAPVLIVLSYLVVGCNQAEDVASEEEHAGTTVAVARCIERNGGLGLDDYLVESRCRQKHHFLLPRDSASAPGRFYVQGPGHAEQQGLFSAGLAYRPDTEEFHGYIRNLSTDYVITGFTVGVNRSGLTTGVFETEYDLTREFSGVWIPPNRDDKVFLQNMPRVRSDALQDNVTQVEVDVAANFLITVVNVYGVRIELL